MSNGEYKAEGYPPAARKNVRVEKFGKNYFEILELPDGEEFRVQLTTEGHHEDGCPEGPGLLTESGRRTSSYYTKVEHIWEALNSKIDGLTRRLIAGHRYNEVQVDERTTIRVPLSGWGYFYGFYQKLILDKSLTADSYRQAEFTEQKACEIWFAFPDGTFEKYVKTNSGLVNEFKYYDLFKGGEVEKIAMKAAGLPEYQGASAVIIYDWADRRYKNGRPRMVKTIKLNAKPQKEKDMNIDNFDANGLTVDQIAAIRGKLDAAETAAKDRDDVRNGITELLGDKYTLEQIFPEKFKSAASLSAGSKKSASEKTRKSPTKLNDPALAPEDGVIYVNPNPDPKKLAKNPNEGEWQRPFTTKDKGKRVPSPGALQGWFVAYCNEHGKRPPVKNA